MRWGAIGFVVALSGPSSAVLAQQIGPPIPPEQMFRQQPAPTTTLPSPSTSSGGGSPSRSTVAPGRPETYRDRVVECQHLAAVDRIPQRDRASFVHNCARN